VPKQQVVEMAMDTFLPFSFFSVIFGHHHIVYSTFPQKMATKITNVAAAMH
ncbi:hypothetical protein HAX54_014771, partial [Datura stramonium]|nr:hypothetical protein [Datura stramonium]